MTIYDVINKDVNKLGNIMIPVSEIDTIGRIINEVRMDLISCKMAIEKAANEQKPPEKDDDVSVELVPDDEQNAT